MFLSQGKGSSHSLNVDFYVSSNLAADNPNFQTLLCGSKKSLDGPYFAQYTGPYRGHGRAGRGLRLKNVKGT
jgi:hypothetical protein